MYLSLLTMIQQHDNTQHCAGQYQADMTGTYSQAASDIDNDH